MCENNLVVAPDLVNKDSGLLDENHFSQEFNNSHVIGNLGTSFLAVKKGNVVANSISGNEYVVVCTDTLSENPADWFIVIERLVSELGKLEEASILDRVYVGKDCFLYRKTIVIKFSDENRQKWTIKEN